MAENTRDPQVLIAGGGMVGSALACALADHGFHVGVVEPRPPARDWETGSFSNRVSALTRASQRVLQRLGTWDRIIGLGATPYLRMQVWDRRGIGEIVFDSADIGEANLGHIVENRIIQLALWERLEQQPKVQLICPSRIVELDLEASQVTLDDDRRFAPDLLVAADGARSTLREMAGIAVDLRDLGQSAVVATVRTALGHRQTAWQRFLPTGPLAFLPVDGSSHCSIVWSVPPNEAQRLIEMDDAAFRAELTTASQARLGDIVETSPREAYPLRSQHAENYVLPGIALVGDAAHVIHPLAGQGVNLGLLDAARLCETLTTARAAGRSISSLATLRRYERARRGENLAVMRAMEGFNLLFSNSLPPLALVRNLGLRLTHAVAPVKNLMVRRAMGLDGDLPPLAAPGTGQGA